MQTESLAHESWRGHGGGARDVPACSGSTGAVLTPHPVAGGGLGSQSGHKGHGAGGRRALVCSKGWLLTPNV